MGNRPAIEAIAERAGFTLVQPEKLSMPAQLALFETATMIVGEYGSALHNSIFAEPGTIICALRGNSRHPGFIQSGIGTVLGQETGYVFGNTAGQEVDQRFDIDPAAFSRALELMMLHRP
jgi:capsular polysaccharide biosynthesis protein